MSQSWKPLPDDLSEPARRLAEELRAVKDAHQISLAELGKRTYLSKASWERWLNGKRLITPQALAGLIATVECDADLLTSLLRKAEAARGADEALSPGAAPAPAEAPGLQPAAPAEAAAPEPAAEAPDAAPAPPRPAPWRRPAAGVGAAVAAVLILFAVLYLRGPHGGNGTASAATLPPKTAAATATAGPAPLCEGVGCAGKDPQAMRCDVDQRTLLTGNVGKVVLYVHYSPRCRAAWSGITDGSPGDSATITTNHGWQETALIHWGYDNYSVMVDASPGDTTLQVCGHQKDGDSCTDVVTDPAARASALPSPPPPAAAPTPAPTPTPTPTP
ncbi:DUF2690 domain-containing protein [Kitasatospora sp. NBC_01300]|uniref:DUF2690 domain-containing protein n=1 Tax=Kitasatospora sp. NBC_01300 TaxID=2903574 RepID=UPI00352D45B7|nr:DUF2690 domain-containing protein [Kitasatospora sp. NBC_01300]